MVASEASATRCPIIDCDMHPILRSFEQLAPYLNRRLVAALYKLPARFGID